VRREQAYLFLSMLSNDNEYNVHLPSSSQFFLRLEIGKVKKSKIATIKSGDPGKPGGLSMIF